MLIKINDAIREQIQSIHRRIHSDNAKNLASKMDDAQSGAEKLGDPSLIDKGRHYVVALAKWTRAGYHVRSPEDAAACEAICKSNECGQYDAETEACKICGCGTSSRRWAIFSKTKMATEVCPRGSWK